MEVSNHQLYDLENDIGEATDLAKKHPAISDSLDGEFFKKNVLDMRFRIREKFFVKSIEYLR